MAASVHSTVSFSIESLLQILQEQQNSDGSFSHQAWSEDSTFRPAQTHISPFSTALICDILSSVTNKHANSIQQAAASFLFKQKSLHWTFNYWARERNESTETSYPDDLDDTAIAIAALFHTESSSIDGVALARIVEVLTSAEVQEGGPYRTWLVPTAAPSFFKDVDLVVNSNISYMLGLFDVQIPHLKEYIEEAIETENYTSPYYVGSFPVLYFLSRGYYGKKQNRIRKFLKKEIRRHAPLELGELALCICTFFFLGSTAKQLKPLMKKLIQAIQKGQFPVSAFIREPDSQKTLRVSGSQALTLSFCIQACQLYEQHLSSNKLQKHNTPAPDQISKEILRQTVGSTDAWIKSLPIGLQHQAIPFIQKLRDEQALEKMALFPYMFGCALGETAKRIPLKTYITLGQATIFGWVTYTLYDDILDERKVEALSLANCALRCMTSCMDDLRTQCPPVFALFHTTLTDMDAANVWELQHCRIDPTLAWKKRVPLPDFGDLSHLAQRSFGHALGPLSILCASGFSSDGDEMKNLRGFYHHYLIAKQLNDDAHDWEEDLEAGILNAVNVRLLQKRLSNSKEAKLEFWKNEILWTAEAIDEHIRLAKNFLKKCAFLSHPEILEGLLTPITTTTQLVVRDHTKARDFLTTFSTVPA